MKTKLLLFVLLAALLQSCMYDSTETFANKNIDAAVRKTIAAKNDSLIEGLVTSNNKIFTTLGSEDFVKHLQAELGEVIWGFRKGYVKEKYTIYDEFHNKHDKSPNNSVITSSTHNYTFTFQNDQKETYVSLLRVTSLNHTDDYLLTVIYSLIGNQWKLDHISVGKLGMYGKSMPEYFELAKQSIRKNFDIDAFTYAEMAGNYLAPAGKMLKFNEETKLATYKGIWLGQINKKYRFPQPVEAIDTKPVVLGMEPIKNKFGVCNLISYISAIPLKDTAAIVQEYEKVKKALPSIYKGLNFNKEFIYYKVYNQPPGMTISEDYAYFEDYKPKSK